MIFGGPAAVQTQKMKTARKMRKQRARKLVAKRKRVESVTPMV